MSLRERLRGRERPVETYLLRVDDTADAQQAYNTAVEEFRIAKLIANDGETGPEVDKAQRAVDRARKKIEACFEPVKIRALAPPDYEALLADHPAKKDSNEPFGEGFPRALFLACVEGDMSAEEWGEFLDKSCSRQEQLELYGTAILVNNRTTTGDGIPKD